MTELKPCPFCGGKAEIFQRIGKRYSEYNVSCGNVNCNVMPETGNFDTEQKAIEAWNRRVDNG